MEVTESGSQKFSQSEPITASVSDQQTYTPAVQDMVCAWSFLDSTTHTDLQGFCEQSANEIVHASLTSVEYELPQTTKCNSAEIGPEKANHRILPNFSKTSTSQRIKGQKMAPSSVGEIDLYQNSNLNVSNLNLQSTASKEDHQSTPTAQSFSPVIISVESLANASNEDNSSLHQSAANTINTDSSSLHKSPALPASSMEVLANSTPIMFLVKNRHNNAQMGALSTGIKDKVTRFIAL